MRYMGEIDMLDMIDVDDGYIGNDKYVRVALG